MSIKLKCVPKRASRSTRMTVMFSALLFLASCASDAPVVTTPTAARDVAPGDVDKLYVVDCLLPPQVRSLGQSINYLAARQPIKTTAIDCQIRGGEYVAYDRADFATSLKVWLPKAQEGDAEAQAFVGEIYERGLGTNPDYATAATWYRKAAEKNNARAQINLGHLYEQGNGVERDLVQAMSWYRRASGLTDQGLQFVSSVEIAAHEADQAELEALRKTVEQQNVEIEKLKQQLQQNGAELEQQRTQSARKQQQISELRLRLDGERKRQQQAAAPSQDSVAKMRELERELKQREDEVAQQQARIAQLEKASAGAQARLRELTAAETQNAQLRKELDVKNQQIAALQGQATDAQSRLGAERARAQQMTAELQQERARVETERARARQTGNASAELATLEKVFKEREAQFAQQQATIRQLETSLGDYRSQAAQMQRAVALMLEPPSIEIVDPPLLVTRSIPTATVTSAVKQREIFGRVKAPAGLLGFSVNTTAQPVNADGTFRIQVPIVGPETHVTMVAVDRRGKLAKLDMLVSAPEASTPALVVKDNPELWNPKGIEWGTYHALIIGNENNKHLPRLTSASADAKDVEQLLRDRYGFKTTRLTDATRYDVMTAINKLDAMLTEKDNLLIYYAGHGNYKGEEGYWLPADADVENDANWIPVRAITDRIATFKAKHIMVIVDSCYSGAMSASAIARDDAALSPELREKWARHMLGIKSRTVLTSGGLKPILDKGEGNHSVFAESFLAALKSNPGVLEGYRVFYKVYDEVMKSSARLGLQQEPGYAPIKNAGHESGTFFFVPTRRNQT